MAVPKYGPIFDNNGAMQAVEERQAPLVPLPVKERKLANSLIPPALMVVAMWCVFLLDRAFQWDMYRFGIFPRRLDGLWGILLSPFIHGDFDHLLNNSIPVLALGWALLYFFPKLAGRVVTGSWLISGAWVWISARNNYHIGASGVVYGLAAFLFISGLLRKQRTLMGLSMLVVFLYGGLLWGMLPLVPRISWESHFWGAAAGAVMAIMYRHVPSAVRDPKPIVWEEDEEEVGAVDDLPIHEGSPVPDPGTPPDNVVGVQPKWHSTDTWNHGSLEK